MSKVLLFWSGGKDSAMCLHVLANSPATEVAGLVVTLDGAARVGMHGVSCECVRLQAEALGLPLVEVETPVSPTNSAYLDAVSGVFVKWREAGVTTLAFGDLFLDDIRAWREREFASLGYECLFPIWGRDTTDLARDFISLGYRALVVTVDTTQISADFCGRNFDLQFLRDLPGSADPAGEQGEFHTFVFDGPRFRRPVSITHNGVRRDRQFMFAEINCNSGCEEA